MMVGHPALPFTQAHLCRQGRAWQGISGAAFVMAFAKVTWSEKKRPVPSGKKETTPGKTKYLRKCFVFP